jgi:hypothetical protein
VRPENAAPAGNRRATEANFTCGLSCKPTQRYIPEPNRRKAAPRNILRVTPTRLASADVNGPILSVGGTHGFTGTEPGSLPRQIRTTLVVKPEHLRPNG